MRLDEVPTALSVVMVSLSEIYRVRSIFLARGNVQMIQPLELVNREIRILERNRKTVSQQLREKERDKKKKKGKGGPNVQVGCLEMKAKDYIDQGRGEIPDLLQEHYLT